MTLGEIIKKYREEQGMSQRKFAAKAGMSNTYVSQLELGFNLKTGQVISPTMETIKSAASAMGIPVDDVVGMMGDSLVDISGDEGSDLDSQIMDLVHRLPEQQKRSLLDLLQLTTVGAEKK